MEFYFQVFMCLVVLVYGLTFGHFLRKLLLEEKPKKAKVCK